MEESICVLCEVSVRPLQQKLTCQNCNDSFHRTCTKMKQDEYRRLKKANELDSWNCPFCQDKSETVESSQNTNSLEARNQTGILESSETNCLTEETNNLANEPSTGTLAVSVEEETSTVTIELSDNTVLEINDNHGELDGRDKNSEMEISLHATDDLENDLDVNQNAELPTSNRTCPASSNSVNSSEVHGDDQIKAKVLSSGNVFLTWKPAPSVLMGSAFFCKYVVTATDVETGYSVYSSETSRFGFLPFTRSETISGLATEKMYIFTVTYWRESEKILCLRTEKTWLGKTSETSSSVTSDCTPNLLSSNTGSSGISSSSSEQISTSSSIISARQDSSVIRQDTVSSSRQASSCSSSSRQNPVVSLSEDSVVSARSESDSSCRQNSVISSRGDTLTTSRQDLVAPSRQETVISSRHEPVVSLSQSTRQDTVSTRQESVIPYGQNTAVSTIMSTEKQTPSSSQKDLVSRELKYGCCEVHGYILRTPLKNNPNIVQLEPLPFYKVLTDLVRLKPLVGVDSHAYCRHQSYNFTLKQNERNLISAVPSQGKVPYRIQLRFCLNNKDVIQSDNFIVGCVRVNGKWAQLQPVGVGCKVGSKGHPVDITSLCDIGANNTVMVSWNQQSNSNGHCLAVQFVEKLTADHLLKIMKGMQYQHSHHTRDLIQKKMKVDGDSEISTTSLRASLMCPIGRVRMSYPCVGSKCTHVQCVDAMTMLQMNETKPTWKCLICSEPVLFEDLRINEYFMNVLGAVSEEVNEIELTADGKWRIPVSETNTEKDDDVNTLSESIHLIDLTESDDENTPPSPLAEVTVSLTKQKKTVTPEAGTKSTVTPLGENRNLLNSVITNARHLATNINIVAAQLPVSFGNNYSQSNVTSCHRNNQVRNHNQRPYSRYNSNCNSGQYRNTSSQSPFRRHNHYRYGLDNCTNNNRTNNNYHSNWNYRSNYNSGSNYNNQSNINYYGQYRSVPWQQNRYI